MEGGEMAEHCRLDERTTHVLEAAIQKFCLSARGCDRVSASAGQSRISAGAASISSEHVAEALQYQIQRVFARCSPTINFWYLFVDILC